MREYKSLNSEILPDGYDAYVSASPVPLPRAGGLIRPGDRGRLGRRRGGLHGHAGHGRPLS